MLFLKLTVKALWINKLDQDAKMKDKCIQEMIEKTVDLKKTLARSFCVPLVPSGVGKSGGRIGRSPAIKRRC